MIPAVAQTTRSPLDGFMAGWLGDPNADTTQAIGRSLQHATDLVQQAWRPAAAPLDGLWAELSRCIPSDTADGDLPQAIECIHVADLALALACRRGHAPAIARFEREHIATLDSTVGRVDASASFVDEVKQRVRTKLLVSEDDSPPKIAHYKGQGPLATWVRVVAAREAISSVRADRRRALADDAGLAALAASATGPELFVVAENYRAHFKRAFQAALAALDPAARNLLRLHYLHGLSIDELGSLLKVHRSSAARRVAKVRGTLLANTRGQLQAELAVGRQDFENLMGLIASRLDLSIERFLASGDHSSGAQ